MNILIATTHVPFVRGGAEIHAEELHRALIEAGHRAEIVRIPFKWYPAERILDQMLAARLLDLTEVNGDKVDLLIGLKFPAYLIPHPRKVLWILHQHRAAYDLWEHALGDLSRDPAGAQVRHAIMQADRNTMTNATRIFANSRNVASRLARFNQIAAYAALSPAARRKRVLYWRGSGLSFFPKSAVAFKAAIACFRSTR
jgi:glycosyltransferase involved in cell wall biosynthesis